MVWLRTAEEKTAHLLVLTRIEAATLIDESGPIVGSMVMRDFSVLTARLAWSLQKYHCAILG